MSSIKIGFLDKKNLVQSIIILAIGLLYVLFLVLINPLSTIHYRLSDQLVTPENPSPNIVVAGIDDETLNTYGVWADWPRSLHTRAIDNLKKRGVLTFEGLLSLSLEELAQEIRPAGYYNIKSGRLKNLIHYLHERFQDDLRLALEERTETLREGLLSVKGVGPETADSILLYAFRRPVFVIDAYTYRILNRHGIYEDPTSYEELREFFQDHLPENDSLYNEFHALIVMAGKNYCRKKPLCNICPLEKWGPDSPSR